MVYHIYCDESRQSKDRYMVLGGIIIPQKNIDEFNATMHNFRIDQNMHAELKWTKVSNQKINEYKRFVDYFFALNNTDRLHFHCIIIDNHKVDHKRFSKGNKELGFYKFYYQLLLHSFGKKYYRHDDRFIVNLDYRNTTYSLDTLKTVLNRGMKKKFSIVTLLFVAVEPRNSKESEIIQINDIILGAIGFQKNGYHLLAHAKKAKKELALYIAEQAGLDGLCKDSPWGKNRFTIWNFQLK